MFCGTLVGEHRSTVRKLKWKLRVGNNLTMNVAGDREKYGRGNQTTSGRGNLLKFIFYQYIVVFLFNTVIYVFLLLGLCILIVRLP